MLPQETIHIFEEWRFIAMIRPQIPFPTAFPNRLSQPPFIDPFIDEGQRKKKASSAAANASFRGRTRGQN